MARVVLFVRSPFGGSLKSGRRFCADAFGRNMASVALKIFYI
jgi:hypothetical protein